MARIACTAVLDSLPVEWVACLHPSPGKIPSNGLVGVTLKPWRPGLPVRQPGVVIANRHLDLRQTLFVEYLVLRDHMVQEEQVGRQRIYLIGGEYRTTITMAGRRQLGWPVWRSPLKHF